MSPFPVLHSLVPLADGIFQVSLNRSFKTLAAREEGGAVIKSPCVECPCDVST